MTTRERDPVSLRAIEHFESDLAELAFWTKDNLPVEPTGSVGLRGYVAFGKIRRKSEKGWYYNVTLRRAKVRFEKRGCQFDGNRGLDAKVQDGALVDRRTTETRRSIEGTVKGNAGGSTSTDKSAAQGALTAEGTASGKRDQLGREERQAERYRARWEANAYVIGADADGDPFSASGTLRGRHFDGDWGDMRPLDGKTNYEMTVALVASTEDLDIQPDPHWLTAKVKRMTRSKKETATVELRQRVLSWAQTRPESRPADPVGYAEDRDEWMLATGRVEVSRMPESAPPDQHQTALQEPDVKPKVEGPDPHLELPAPACTEAVQR